jgi:hypothetical protein
VQSAPEVLVPSAFAAGSGGSCCGGAGSGGRGHPESYVYSIRQLNNQYYRLFLGTF